MALRVVSSDLNDRGGTVIIEADSQEEVMSSAARQLAIDTATRRVARCGTSGNEVAYPVDAQGETSEDLVLGRAGPAHAYRCDYKISGGL